MALGEYEGKHYGLPTNINLKSMVWYPKDDFDAAGYEVPETWDDLIALSDQIVEDGSTPWCVGFESGGDTGWPATDWMEDIMLRTAGPEVYDQWVAHEIPFNDPAVKAAAETVRRDPVRRGLRARRRRRHRRHRLRRRARSRCSRTRRSAGCTGRRASSTRSSREDAEAGVDYDWFPLPPIDQEGILYAGELTVVGKNGNRPEVVDFLERFIAEDVQCEMGGVQASSRISPNVNVGPGLLRQRHPRRRVGGPDRGAGGGHRAVRRLRPHAGGGRERQLLDRHDRRTCRSGPDSLDGVLADIEASWP